MKISELFYSIQGEGKRSGVPSFFIRTNHCNLRCKFTGGNLCDTAYTSWFPDDISNIGEMKIKSVINEYEKIKCRDVVITGGEPTMFPEDLEKLCRNLRKVKKNIYLTIETNGTCIDNFVKYADLISISPKLKSSVPLSTEFEKMHQRNRLNIKSFRKYNLLKRKNEIDIQWKFVFTGMDDIDEIRSLQKEVGFKKEDVYLMPEGITEEELIRKRTDAIDVCREYGYNYTDRLHILIWGNKRGT